MTVQEIRISRTWDDGKPWDRVTTKNNFYLGKEMQSPSCSLLCRIQWFQLQDESHIERALTAVFFTEVGKLQVVGPYYCRFLVPPREAK